MTNKTPQKILKEILDIDKKNLFLKYIVQRLCSNDYRGWHVSQHNRYTINDIGLILHQIYNFARMEYFAIPPGDYNSDAILPAEYEPYQMMVNEINSNMGRGTLNSIKKNFFPDLEGMNFLRREKRIIDSSEKTVLHGQLTDSAVALINADTLIDKYKKFTDGIDKLFGNKISELAGMISLSDFANDSISIYEFMFILSDNDEDLDKIELLASYRGMKKYQRNKVIELVDKYARPDNFTGNKTALRDFHNWKNQAQQILSLLNSTVYFKVEHNDSFRLNVGNTGFFQKPSVRSSAPKQQYFNFHGVTKRDKFELHHIIPISAARNKIEAKKIDDYRNLIYIHKEKHKVISKSGNKHVVLGIDPNAAIFSDFDNTVRVEAVNNRDAFYTAKQNKIKKMAQYNIDLLKSIFNFEQ